MTEAELIQRLEYIERKLKLEYYLDAQREVDDLLFQLGRVRELTDSERTFMMADAKLGDPKP